MRKQHSSSTASLIITITTRLKYVNKPTNVTYTALHDITCNEFTAVQTASTSIVHIQSNSFTTESQVCRQKCQPNHATTQRVMPLHNVKWSRVRFNVPPNTLQVTQQWLLTCQHSVSCHMTLVSHHMTLVSCHTTLVSRCDTCHVT